MLGGQTTYELLLENCKIPADNLLGEIGKGFAPMQTRLTRRRLEMAAWSIGMARRALQMMVEQANQRVLFGSKLADKQSLQWNVANIATKIHATRLMALETAWKQDNDIDVKTEASMLKFYATEMATKPSTSLCSHGARWACAKICLCTSYLLRCVRCEFMMGHQRCIVW